MPSAKRIFFYAVLLILPNKALFGQSNFISGQILDEENKPVLGALVSISPSADETKYDNSITIAQAITNKEGKFNINIPDNTSILISARHLGFSTHYRKIQKTDQEVSIVLTKQPLPLDEIVIYSLKNDKTYKDAAVPVGVLSSDQWSGWMPRNLSEVAENIPGISKAADGIWANSINIRGFGEDRFVSLVNGNRIETATDLQGALSTIDMDDVEKVEVIKGGISSLYGSGALGGAINVITKQAAYSSRPYLQGNAAVEYQSVNNLWSPRSTLFAGSQTWNAKVHFGYRNAVDAQSPEGSIPNSRFTDWNFTGRIAIRPLAKHEVLIDYQKFDGNAGIPGGANLPSLARATYLDFDRELLSVEYQIEHPLPSLKNISAKYYRQDIFRNVEIQPNAPPKSSNSKQVTPLLINPSATHLTNGATLQSSWNFGSRHELIVGYDLWQRNLETQRTRHILQETLDQEGSATSSVNLIRGETPIPSSRFRSGGIFTQYDLTISSKLALTAGGRLDRITLSNEESKDPEYMIREGERIDQPPGQFIIYPGTSTSNTTWAVHTGVSYDVKDDISLTTSYGRSYRAPSLEERYKYINLGHTVEMGNVDLVPEQGHFVDVGIKMSSSRIHLTGNLFTNYIDKMITMAPADSISFLMSNETDFSQKIFARRYKNVDEALLTGFEFGIDWLLYPAAVAYGQVSLIRGVERNTQNNLPGIVPLNGLVGWRQKVSVIGNFDLRARFFGAQNKVAEGEIPTEGYLLLDCYLNSEPIRLNGIQFQISVGVDNLTNTRYRSHLSTNRGNWMLEPGRNMKFKLGVTW
jgi:hemoglobin/transferrin/lactoferrin receptor protein